MFLGSTNYYLFHIKDTYNKSQAASRASPVQLLPEDVPLTGPGMYMVPPGYYATPMEMYGGPTDGIAGVHYNSMVTSADVHHSSHSRRVQFKTRQVFLIEIFQFYFHPPSTNIYIEIRIN